MKYRVSIPYLCYVTVTVDAGNEDEAVEKACDDGSIASYGGTDKLVGVSSKNASIEAPDSPFEGCGCEITVEET